MQRSKAFLLLIVITFFGCDIPAYLTVKNRTNSAVRIKFIEHPNPQWPITGMHGSVWANAEEQVFSVPLKAHQRQHLYLMGPYSEFGWQWNDTGITRYVSRLERIDLISQTDSTSISDQTELFNRFRAGRRGLFKRRVVLKLP